MALVFLGLTMTSCSDKPVLPTQLPPDIQAFVKQHFPTQNIAFANKDLTITGWEYDVVLADGTQIDFDTSHQWDQIDCKLAAVPATLVPAPIATSVQANFQGVPIVKIDKTWNGYEVELANDIELQFNEAGALTQLDD